MSVGWPVGRISLPRFRRPLKRSVVRKLQFKAIVALLQQLDGFLKQIAALAADPDEIALNRSLNLDLAVLDGPDDFLALLNRNARLNRDFLPHGSARSRNVGSVDEILQRDLTLGQLLLKHIDDGFELEIVGA